MKNLKSVALVLFFLGCRQSEKPKFITSTFPGGLASFIIKQKSVNDGFELSLFSKYKLNNEISSEQVTHFQYQLGENIKIIIGHDTISPKLAYYVPLINQNEKEIDCKYILTNYQRKEPKLIIIQDSLLKLNKITASFQ